MYRLKIIEHFSSAHQLRGYQGECEELHGHNWKVEVEVEGRKLNSIGLLIDFKQLKQLTHTVLKQLDHKFLNTIEEFKNTNPSSELIARYIYSEIKTKLPPQLSIASITVWESEKACAAYWEDH